jgi:hypothetical protein
MNTKKIGAVTCNIPGWYLSAPVLYAFFNSCSVAFGETYYRWLAHLLSLKGYLGLGMHTPSTS